MSIYKNGVEDEYIICPISVPEYQHCDENCKKCKTYIEFVKGLEELENEKNK